MAKIGHYSEKPYLLAILTLSDYVAACPDICAGRKAAEEIFITSLLRHINIAVNHKTNSGNSKLPISFIALINRHFIITVSLSRHSAATLISFNL